MPRHSLPIPFLAGFVCAGLGFPSLASEKNAGAPVHELYHVSQWTSEDGLPANRVNALAQTSDGYLWLGTWFGLARFDGVRFVIFNSANTPELSVDQITALAVDRLDGSLWVGTSDGLLLMRGGTWQRLPETQAMAGSNISKLAASARGGVWARAWDRVAHCRDGGSTFTQLAFAPGELGQELFDSAEGHALVMTSARILRVTAEGDASEWPLLKEGRPGPYYASQTPIDQTGRCWLSTADALMSHRGGRWIRELQFSSRQRPSDYILAARDGSTWSAHQFAGLWHHGGGIPQPIRLGSRAAEKSVSCLLEDRDGHVWVGTAQGLFQVRPRLMRVYSVEDDLPHRECWSVCEAPDGAVWVETHQGLARIQGDRVEVVPHEPLRQPSSSVLVDADGVVWVGDKHREIIAWRPGVATNRWAADGVDALYRDRENRVWVGTSRGVKRFENGQPATSLRGEGSPASNVRSIYQTRDGTLWFGTWKEGLIRWRGEDFSPADQTGSRSQSGGTSEVTGAWGVQGKAGSSNPEPGSVRYTVENGLADNRVFALHEDGDGALWIGTHNGLSRFKDGRFFTFRTEHGLFDNLINWLEEDNHGRFWFSCNRGIFRIHRSELDAVAEGRRARALVTVYGVADGMLTPETNGEHQPAGCKTRDGRLWFPTMDGVVVIDPRLGERERSQAAPVIIEEVASDGERIGGSDFPRAYLGREKRGAPAKARDEMDARAGIAQSEVRLAAGRARVLQVRYTSNAFVDPKRVRFRYRLAGYDPDWRGETAERVAYYANLAPGNYRFEVRASDPHGVWSQTAAVFPFSVAPYFWQTRTCQVLAGLGAILAVAAHQAWRLRWQRRVLEANHQEALASERTRIARDLHDDLGTALTGLALEMDVAGRDASALPDTARKLNGAALHARTLADRMREVVWAVNPRCDNVPSLAGFLEEQAEKMMRSAGLGCRLELPESVPDLPLDSETRHEIALCVREACTNIIRHAQAQQVSVRLTISDGRLMLVIADDGIGLSRREDNGTKHGLPNLHSRMRRIGGTFSCHRGDEGGTVLTFELPLKSRSASVPNPLKK